MNQIHVLLYIHNVHFFKTFDTYYCIYIMTCFVRHNHVLLSMHNVHVLLRHESDTCITVYT